MKKFLKILLVIFLIGTAYYVYRMADLYFNQEKYVFNPVQEISVTPESVGLVYEDVLIETSDGVKLSAWYLPASNAKGTVLYFHGSSRNISLETEAEKMFHLFGWNVLAPDYRGFGKSEGVPTEEGVYLDAQAAWDWLVQVKKEKPNRIIICGRSLGSGVASDLAAKNSAGGLILEAAFTSLPEAGQDMYPYFPVKLLTRYKFDTLNKLQKVFCPVLLVHSHDDELIPFKHARALYEVIRGKKSLVELGGPHKGGWKPTLGKYEQSVKLFLASI